ncbi:MAG: MBL fold metallo-hydrolase, partial [Muribaculaceae bacterium]|nr:MBL fold metallo-hydrolase [Muribaculaceae bacterium]
MALNIKSFVFNMFGINTYVVWDQDTRQAMVVDPGMIDTREQQTLTNYIDSNHLSVTHLVNTHMHLDHIFGNDFTKSAYGVQVEANKNDEPFGLNREAQARRFGLRGDFAPAGIDRSLDEGDTISLGDNEFVVLHIPGHSPGSIVLY